MPVTFRTGIRAPEQSVPSTPAAGFRMLYAKSTGWYDLDSAGTERLLTHAIEAYPFSVNGALTVRTGVSRIYLEGNYTFETCRASVGTAPTGATLIVDVKKNGTTIYSTQSARPTIAISGFSANGNSPAITTFASGDYLTVDIAQIGSTVAGSDLVVTIRLRKTS
jgi:hypothetical protein